MIINSTPSNVTWFSSAQSGMPKINHKDPDGIIKILDACLVKGGIEKNVLTATISDNNVILDFGVGHGFNLYQNIYITGADDSLLNGTHKVVSSTNNTATIAVVGALVGSGAIKARIAPLGYESIFGVTDPLKRAYRSLASSSSKQVLYLDMGYPASAGYNSTSPARRAMISVCEDMQQIGVQINSYTDLINDNPANPNGSLFWYQSRGATKTTAIDSGEVPWKVIGNGDFFYLCVNWSRWFRGMNVHDVYGFGEYVSIGDVSNRTFVSAINSNNDNDDLAHEGRLGSRMSGDSASNYVLSSSGGSFAKQPLCIISGVTSQPIVSGLTGATYPSSSGNLLFTHAPKILGVDRSIIGFSPSMQFIDHTTRGDFDGQVIDGVLMVRVKSEPSTAASFSNVGFYVGV